MSRSRDALMVMVALVAGLVGGVVSSELLRGTPIFVQKAPQLGKVLQAERFEVVDQAGKTLAALGTAPDGSPNLTLFDQAGKLRAALGHAKLEAIGTGATENRAVSSLVLFDKDGKVLWEAP